VRLSEAETLGVGFQKTIPGINGLSTKTLLSTKLPAKLSVIVMPTGQKLYTSQKTIHNVEFWRVTGFY
jgi:hypothetical protein